MKKTIITTASAAGIMAGVIIIRTILSIHLSDQAAEVFSRVSIGILFYYIIVRMIRLGKLKLANKSESSIADKLQTTN